MVTTKCKKNSGSSLSKGNITTAAALLMMTLTTGGRGTQNKQRPPPHFIVAEAHNLSSLLGAFRSHQVKSFIVAEAHNLFSLLGAFRSHQVKSFIVAEAHNLLSLLGAFSSHQVNACHNIFEFILRLFMARAHHSLLWPKTTGATAVGGGGAGDIVRTAAPAVTTGCGSGGCDGRWRRR